ncbi:MAG: glycosyltransferase family 39 protein [Planctomycetota bacterium]
MRAWLSDTIDDGLTFLSGERGRRWLIRAAPGPIGGLALVVLCVALYLPGTFVMPAVDRDEARFAQASRQMFESAALPEDQQTESLHSGGWIVPRIGERDRLNKPPLIYWLQVGSAAAFTGGDPSRDAIWMYRIPSALFATLAVLFTWRIGVSMFDPRAGLLAAALLAACPLVLWDAHQARADQLLLACTTGAMWGLWSTVRSTQRRWVGPILTAAAIGLGILAKGPITPMIVLLTALVLLMTRRWRFLLRARPITSLAVIAVLIAPWAYIATQRVGFDTLLASLTDETLGRATEAKENHGGPPGYHVFMLPLMLWPGVLLTGAALVRGWHRARPFSSIKSSDGRGRLAETFCLAWIIPSWIVFEAVTTKLPHYTMPLYPALALLTARGVFAAADDALPGIRGAAAGIGYWLWVILGVAVLVVAPIGVSILGGGWIVIGITVAVALAARYLLHRARRELMSSFFLRAQLWSIAAFVVGAIALVGVALPRASSLWITTSIMNTIEAIDPDRARPLAAIDFHEDSLVFASRAQVVKLDMQDLRSWMRANPNGLVVIPRERLAELDPVSGPRLNPLDTASGFNYSSGRLVDLVIAEIEP